MSDESPHIRQIWQKLDEIRPNCYSALDTIAEFPLDIALRIIQLLIAFACQSQHVAMIQCARRALLQIPSHWLVIQLPAVIADTIKMNDDWEFRRMLEMLDEIAPQLVQGYVQQGLHGDLDIREAAEDWLSKGSQGRA